MKKPKVILADTDADYLVSLEIKFLESLGDDIDLEVITEAELFQKKFSLPVSADVLVVSQDLYQSRLQKQDVGTIFILVERVEERDTGDLAEKWIYKYSSTKNIFKQILAGSGGTLGNRGNDSRDTRVVLVYSPLGGIGKTTVALGISAGLTQGFQKVLYIDAERLNAFPHFFADSTAIPARDIGNIGVKEENLFDRVKHLIRTEKFDFFPPFSAALSALNLDFSFYRALIESARSKQQYDLIVVDTDSAFDPEKAALLTQADTVVMLLRQNADSIHTMNVLLRNIQSKEDDKYLFLCSDFNPNRPNALVSPPEQAEFVVSEYVRHMESLDEMTIDALAAQEDIQKICYLVS